VHAKQRDHLSKSYAKKVTHAKTAMTIPPFSLLTQCYNISFLYRLKKCRERERESLAAYQQSETNDSGHNFTFRAVPSLFPIFPFVLLSGMALHPPRA
jgi:hypothetical protein